MRDDDLIEGLREGLRRQRENPHELWEKLIQEGIIDEQGHVLVRMPEPPPREKKNKKHKRKKIEGSTDGKDKS